RFSLLSEWGHDVNLLSEVRCWDLLRRCGLPAVDSLDVDLTREICPYDYAVLARVPGSSLSSRYSSTAAVELEQILNELGAIVAALVQLEPWLEPPRPPFYTATWACTMSWWLAGRLPPSSIGKMPLSAILFSISLSGVLSSTTIRVSS